jgi:hypothetical protein
MAPSPSISDLQPSAGPSRAAAVRARLDRPLCATWCFVGWCVATALFVGLIGLYSGPSLSDVNETIYSTWAVAHGQLACAYPAVSDPGEPAAAPLYPLLSGGIAFITRVGHGLAFPSAAALGAGCRNVFQVVSRWYPRAHALYPTLRIGCVAWLALMAGVIAWLRASGRGRCGWEPLTLVALAVLPPVWMCLQSTFHPQDLLAMGLALAAMGCARRNRWVLSGILCALAVLTQQFALLVAAPLLVLAPAPRRMSFAGAAALTGAAVVLPLAVLTSGHALRAIALGTGDNPAVGGTVLWETHAYGVAGILLYRVAPIAVSLALSWWVARRLGTAALEPVALISLVAVSLSLRLVFEANLFSYYFMAMTVSLVLLEVARGSIRPAVVAWLATLSIVVCRTALPPGTSSWETSLLRDLTPLLIGGCALVVVVVQLARGVDVRTLWPLAGVVAVDLFMSIPGNAFSTTDVPWFWQFLLVVPGLLLAARSLRTCLRQPGDRTQDRARPLGAERGHSRPSAGAPRVDHREVVGSVR